ncbi:MAG: TetR/AcrR family transcriptional regulator [Candidatus Zixiibacteriota bacterium]
MATMLFSRDGFDKVTIKQVARRCKITEPAIYRHFESKVALCEAVLDAVGERLAYNELFERLESEDNVENLLRQLALHIVNFFTENQDIYRLLLFSALAGHPHARQVYDAIRGAYARFLREQLDRLYSRDLIVKKNNEITARCFVGMVFDCAMANTLWKGMQGKVYTPSDVVANNVPIYAQGLKP